MSAMDQMLASMLGKMIPAEVLELLSPENIQELKEMAGSFVAKISEDLETIKSQNEAILAGLTETRDCLYSRARTDSGELKVMLDKVHRSIGDLNNVDKLSKPDDNGDSNRSRSRSNSRKPSGSGSD